mgnify:CR=1 FL=1
MRQGFNWEHPPTPLKGGIDFFRKQIYSPFEWEGVKRFRRVPRPGLQHNGKPFEIIVGLRLSQSPNLTRRFPILSHLLGCQGMSNLGFLPQNNRLFFAPPPEAILRHVDSVGMDQAISARCVSLFRG